MQQYDFEAELRSAGYTEIESKALDPRPGNLEHVHDYDIRGLVLDGVFIVTQGDQSSHIVLVTSLRCPPAKGIQKESGRTAHAFSSVANIS